MSSVSTNETLVGTTAVVLVPGDADGNTAIVRNESANTVHVGGADVTVANGFPVAAGAVLSFSTPSGLSFHAVAAIAGSAVRVMIVDR